MLVRQGVAPLSPVGILGPVVTTIGIIMVIVSFLADEGEKGRESIFWIGFILIILGMINE